MNSETNTDTVSPASLSSASFAGCQIIDVREPVEYAEAHIAGARSIPLGALEARAGEIDKSRPVIVMCQAGKRGAAAADKLRSLGFPNVRNLEGGLDAWRAAGLACENGNRRVIPLMRQVQIAVGVCVLTASLLTAFADVRWAWLTAFFGAGLIFAGASGFCGFARILARAPWNRLLAGGFLTLLLFGQSACHHLSSEGPETAPVGPPVLSDALLAEAKKGPVQFHRHIEPLLRQNCLPCHDGKQMPAFVNLTSRESAFARGPYGPRIVPGHPEQSLLIRNLSLTHAPVKSMPPVGSRMTPEETAILRKWIREGAQWP